MAAFEYFALNARGKEEKGILEADSSRQVRQNLRDKGLSPLSVTVTSEQKGGSENNLFAVKNDTELLIGDLRSDDFALRATKDCDVVFHLAADHGGRRDRGARRTASGFSSLKRPPGGGHSAADHRAT